MLRPGSYNISIGGHDGDQLSAGHSWIFASEVYTFSIQEVWSNKNDFNSKGLINVPFNGTRTIK
jgi:hypothetical protein